MKPSRFALFAADHWLKQATDILEIGCGNGRDATWFASNGHRVTGLDLSEKAIAACLLQQSAAEFVVGDFSEISIDRRFSVIYSRFTLHSVDDETEAGTLDSVSRHLRPGGRFIIEARTIYDELCGRGERISDREWIHENHYRRFLEPVEFISRAAEFGFIPEYILMSSGLAPWGDQDPVVIRVVFRSQS